MINTARLVIKTLSEEDAHFIFDLLNTDGWIRYIGYRHIHAEADALAYIRKITEDPDTRYWTVRLNETNATIGLVTLIRRDYLDFHDIGFAFLPQYANKGYAYEAAQAVLSKLAKGGGIENILAITLPGNTASIRLIEKLGLRFERIIERSNEKLYLYSGSVKQVIRWGGAWGH